MAPLTLGEILLIEAAGLDWPRIAYVRHLIETGRLSDRPPAEDRPAAPARPEVPAHA